MTWICSIIIAGKGKCCTPDKTSMQDKPVDLFSVGMMLACPQNERVILWYTPLTQGVCVCTASFCSLLSCSFLFFFLSSRHAISQFRLSLSERIQSFFLFVFFTFPHSFFLFLSTLVSLSCSLSVRQMLSSEDPLLGLVTGRQGQCEAEQL